MIMNRKYAAGFIKRSGIDGIYWWGAKEFKYL